MVDWFVVLVDQSTAFVAIGLIFDKILGNFLMYLSKAA